jgi:hypothetical protein
MTNYFYHRKYICYSVALKRTIVLSRKGSDVVLQIDNIQPSDVLPGTAITENKIVRHFTYSGI